MMVSRRVRRVPNDIETSMVDTSATKSFDTAEDTSFSPIRERREQKYASKKSTRPRMKKCCYVVILLAVIFLVCSFFSDRELALMMIEDNLMPLLITPEPKRVDLSVVILTYNKHLLLKQLMPSIISQKGVNFELILVDNGCLQETKQVYDEMFSNDDDKTVD